MSQFFTTDELASCTAMEFGEGITAVLSHPKVIHGGSHQQYSTSTRPSTSTPLRNCNVRVSCHALTVLHPLTRHVFCDLHWPDIVDIKQRRARMGGRESGVLTTGAAVRFAAVDGTVLVLETLTDDASSAILKVIHLLADSTSSEERRDSILAQVPPEEHEDASQGGHLLSPQQVKQYESQQQSQTHILEKYQGLANKYQVHKPAAGYDDYSQEERESIEQIRQREEMMRKDIAPPRGRSSSSSAVTTSETERRRKAAAQRRSSSNSSSGAASESRAVSVSKAFNTGEALVEKIKKEISDDQIRRSVSAQSRETQPLSTTKTIQDIRRDDVTRDMEFLLTQMERDEKEAHRAMNAQRQRLGKDPIPYNPPPIEKPPLAPSPKAFAPPPKAPPVKLAAQEPPLQPVLPPTPVQEPASIFVMKTIPPAEGSNPVLREVSPPQESMLQKLALQSDTPTPKKPEETAVFEEELPVKITTPKVPPPAPKLPPPAHLAPPRSNEKENANATIIQQYVQFQEAVSCTNKKLKTLEDAVKVFLAAEKAQAAKEQPMSPRATEGTSVKERAEAFSAAEKTSQPEIKAKSNVDDSKLHDQKRAPRTSGEWKEVFDTTRQKFYFYNSSTRKTTWKVEETPFATMSLDEGTQPSSPAKVEPRPESPKVDDSKLHDPKRAPRTSGEWKEVFDTTRQKFYFYNSGTRKTTWKVEETPFATMSLDEGTQPSSPAKVEPRPESPKVDDSKLHDPKRAPRTSGEWKEVFDTTRQKFYFYNSSTRKTTWKVEETPFATMSFETPEEVQEKKEGAPGVSPSSSVKVPPPVQPPLKQPGAKDPPPAVQPSAKDSPPLVQKREESAKEETKVVQSEKAEDPKLNDPNRPHRTAGDWKEVFDEKKSKYYYYNKATKATTWKIAETPFATMSLDEGIEVQPTAASPGKEAAQASLNDPDRTPRQVGDWREVFDAKKGKFYFCNKATKTTTWKIEETPFAVMGLDEGIPESSTSKKEKKVIDVNDPNRTPRKSGDWREVFDAKKGKFYFCNKATKTTTWKIDETPFAKMTLEAEEEEEEDAKEAYYEVEAPDGRKYFKHAVTGKKVWKLPEGAVVESKPSHSKSKRHTESPAAPTEESAVAEVGQEKPAAKEEKSGGTEVLRESGNWKEIKDAASGRIYYYNKEKKKKQWSNLGTPWAPDLS